jgi:hypothetical protein
MSLQRLAGGPRCWFTIRVRRRLLEECEETSEISVTAVLPKAQQACRRRRRIASSVPCWTRLPRRASARPFGEDCAVRISWTVYIGLLLLIGLGRMLERILADRGGFASRYLPALAAGIICTGIYGALSRKRILWPCLWQLVFWISVVASVLLVGFAVFLLVQNGRTPLFVFALIGAAIALPIPAQIKIREYAFKSADIWHRPAAQPAVEMTDNERRA